MRARLHRRLFAWFATSILITALAVGAVLSLADRSWASNWKRTLASARVFLGHQFEATWEDAAARTALAARITDDLGIGVQLEDAKGQPLPGSTARCRRPLLVAEVGSAPSSKGRVALCRENRAGSPWLFLASFAAAVGVLWAASGKIARRLARPLSELSNVVQELGKGNLSARASLSARESDEIGVVAEAVNEMAARIEKQLADQRELLAAVSHELRTPLSRIRLLTELGRSGEAGPRTFDDVDREVVEIDDLVGELLANSRLDFAALDPRPLELRDVAARALERAGLPLTKLSIETDVSSVQADATLLARALANLLDNAGKHGGGLLALRVSSGPKGVCFEALDAGPGLPEGEAASLFEPFHRRAGGRERAEGSLGLGLSLVKRIALAHGGSVEAGARPEGGARVAICLPLHGHS